MNPFAKRMALIVAVATEAATDAFVAPSTAFLAPLVHVEPSVRGSSGDGDDGSTTINIALINSSNGSYDELRATLIGHPFCKMTGVALSIEDVPTSDGWGKEQVAILQLADIACFEDKSTVISYLKQLDSHLGAEDASDDDRRKLPNKPDVVGAIVDMSEGAPTADATLMAACPSTNAAREALNSGRWMSNHIYYPKDASAVELKTQPVGGEGEEAEDEAEEDIDLNVWADSVMQAAGDVMERKFWGGGW